MPAIKKVTEKDKGDGQAIVVEKIESHADDPYVVKKAAKAKEIISKIDFTGDLSAK